MQIYEPKQKIEFKVVNNDQARSAIFYFLIFSLFHSRESVKSIFQLLKEKWEKAGFFSVAEGENDFRILSNENNFDGGGE